MNKRFLLVIQLVLYLTFLAATVRSQAVVPNPADIAPVINPPNPQTNIVLSLADFMVPGVTTYQAFKNALAAARQQHAAKLVIPTGRYVFDDPQILQLADHTHLGIYNLSDFVIDGQGSELVFHYVTLGIGINGCQRLVIRNLSVDSDLPLASVGIVNKETDGTTSVRILDNYPVTANTPISAVSSSYDIQNLKWKAGVNNEEVYYPTNVVLIRPQTFTSPDFSSLKNGAGVVVRHYAYGGDAFGVGKLASDIALENVTVYGCPGRAFAINAQRGFSISNSKIMQKPGTQRPVSATAGGLIIGNMFGDILAQDCDFSGHGDDSLNIYANWLVVTQRINARTVVLTQPQADLISSGAVLRFVKPDTFDEYARVNVTQVTYDQSTSRYTVTVDQDLPGNLAVNDQVVNLTQSNHRFLIRRNYFHDHRVVGMKIDSLDGVVENNRVKDTTTQALALFADPAYYPEGPGAGNVIVRNNTFEGCGYSNYGTAGASMGCVNITVDVTPQSISSAPVIKNILFEGNTISRTPGLALFISSASGITVSNNLIIDSNTLGAFPPWYGSGINVTPHGSIMVTKASNVLLTGNLQFTRNQQPEKGIFIDPQNTSGVSVQGNRESLLLTNPSYTYDSLNRLTSIIYANGLSLTYTYDAAGNRLPVPGLLTELPSSRAMALDSVTLVRDPFSFSTRLNFSSDQRTRLMLLAMNIDLQPGESASVITAQAEDSQQRVYPLTVEYVGKVPNFDWLTQIVVRLPDGLSTGGDVQINISLRGVVSNRALTSIRPSQ